MKSYPQSHLENGLPEPVIQKIRIVFAHYSQIKKRFCMAHAPKVPTKTVLILT